MITIPDLAQITRKVSQLLDSQGHRKYFTAEERAAFLVAARDAEPPIETFCLVLAFTRCRISEALALTADRVDLKAHTLTFESLKKRRRGVFRAIPVPDSLLRTLALVHPIRAVQRSKGHGQRVRLWAWSRSTATRRVADVIGAAGITGPHATSKGLRHAFGVTGVQKAPLNLVQKWLGHADIATTAIYADAVGEEEAALAARMWE